LPYCTLQQLTDRYSLAMLVEISDRGETPTGTVDAALIDRAIADADALIDGYLKTRYALPLAAVPALVTDLSLIISIYKAHAHEGALRTLRDIASGMIRLDVAGAEPATSGASEVRTNEPHRPLSADTMKGYI
jgi:phage gp36-like protein